MGNLRALIFADLEHDGWEEILGGTDDGQVILWTAGGQRLWEFQVETDWVTGLSTTDLDGDGFEEVLVTAAGILPTSYLYVLRLDGTLWWSHTVREDLWEVLPYNLDEDAEQELLLSARRPVALDTSGAEIPGWPVEVLRTPHVQLVNWDGDDHQDVVTLTNDSLSIVKAEGAPRSIPIELPGNIQAVDVSDIGGDGLVELVVLTDEALMLLENDGSLRWTWPLRGAPGGFRLIRSPVGSSWIVLSDTISTIVLNENGQKQWDFDPGLPGGQTFVLAADENLSLVGTTSGQVYLLDGEGRQLAEYDLDAPVSHAMITDLNGDGHAEVLLTAAGTLYSFGIPGKESELHSWWSYPAGGPVVFLGSGDVDGDGRTEIFLVERNGRLTMLDRKGSLVWQHVHQEPLKGWAQDGLGHLLTWSGTSIHRHNGQGAILWEYHTSGVIRAVAPAFGGVATLTDAGQVALHSLEDGGLLWTVETGPGAYEMAGNEAGLVVFKRGVAILLDSNGAQIWHSALNPSVQNVSLAPKGGVIVHSPVQLFWLGNDGKLLWDLETQPAERITSVEAGDKFVVVGTDARAVALDWQGIETWSRPFEEVISAVSIVDIDADGEEETAIGTVKGSVVLLSSQGEELWRDRGRERVNDLSAADLNADGLPEILAGFEDGALTVYGLVLNQPPWVGAPYITAVGDGYQYAVQVHDPEGGAVGVELEIWDPSERVWKLLGSATAPNGEGTLTWNVPNPFDTWDAGKDSAFRFIWDENQKLGTSAALPGPLNIPTAPWYVTYGRIAGLVALIVAAPTLLLVLVRRTRAHRQSPLGQAEATLLRLTLDPDETLLELHRLLSDETRALALLEHLPGLAREAGNVPLADLLDGYHLALARPDLMVEALRMITEALKHSTGLPQAREMQGFAQLLMESLTDTSIEHVVKRRKALDKLGALLGESEAYLAASAVVMRRLGSIARTLHASDQVEATSDRIAYLAEATADLGELERYISSALTGLELRVTLAATRHWIVLVTETLEGLRGRAEVEITLHTLQLIHREELILGFTLANVGHSPATDLSVSLIPGEGLSPGSDPVRTNVLSPGTNVRLELAARPVGSVGTFEITLRIVWDDRERAGKQAYVTERVRLIPMPSEFRPIPNPYATGRPLAPGSPVFVGRDDVFAFVAEKLADHHILVLVGERRMGKTSLLRQLPARLGNTWMVAYLDGQGLGLEGGLVHWLADAALEISRVVGPAHPAPSPIDLGIQPGPTFEAYLQRITEKLPEGHRLLVILDEFEEIEARVRDGDLPASIFSYLRHLMQFGEMGFLLAGTQRLERLSPEYWTPLFNISMYREVGLLDEESTRKLVVEPVEGRLLYDDLTVDKLLRLSGRQPYFLQLLCHALVSYCNRERLAYVTPAEVDPAVEEAMMLGQAHLRFLWESASAEGQTVLTTLAWLISRGELGTLEAISDRLNSVSYDQANMHLPAVLDQLVSLGLVSESTAGRYVFTSDLMMSWVRRTKMR